MLKASFFLKGGGGEADNHPQHVVLGQLVWTTITAYHRNALWRGVARISPLPDLEGKINVTCPLKSPNRHILIILFVQVLKINTAWVLQVRTLSVTEMFKSSLAILTYMGKCLRKKGEGGLPNGSFLLSLCNCIARSTCCTEDPIWNIANHTFQYTDLLLP